MLGSYLLLFYLIIAIALKSKSHVVIIFFISITNDLFTIPFGVNLPFHNIISLYFLIYFIINKFFNKDIFYKYGINYLFLEQFYVIIITIIFGILIGWHTDYDYLREWNQKSELKSIVQIIKLIADISILFIFNHFIDKEKIKLKFLNKTITYIYFGMLIIGLIDILTHHSIKGFLFSSTFRENLFDRFTSLNGEPRAFAKVSIFIFIYSILLMNNKNKFLTFLSILGIFISLSASGIFVFILILIFYLIYRKKYLLITSLTLLILLITFSINNLYFDNKQFSATITKMNFVLGTSELNMNENEDIIESEPVIFKSFEIFDRAALNFLYSNPFYSITGVGSNLISLPASPYLTNAAKMVYGERIDSAPHSFFINLLSRSGLIGLSLWILFFIRSTISTYKISRKYFYLNIMNFTFIFLINNIFFFIFLSFIINDKENA